jgi:hypothetical protein
VVASRLRLGGFGRIGGGVSITIQLPHTAIVLLIDATIRATQTRPAVTMAVLSRFRCGKRST